MTSCLFFYIIAVRRGIYKVKIVTFGVTIVTASDHGIRLRFVGDTGLALVAEADQLAFFVAQSIDIPVDRGLDLARKNAVVVLALLEPFNDHIYLALSFEVDE